jgi:hypothetical protein
LTLVGNFLGPVADPSAHLDTVDTEEEDNPEDTEEDAAVDFDMDYSFCFNF